VVHDDRAHCWESKEYSVNNLTTKLFKLCINIVKAVKSRLSEFLELRLYQIVKHVNGWETRDTITFVHSNGALDHHVSVLLGGFKLFKICVEFIETHLDTGTARKLLSLGTSSLLTTGIVFTTNLIFVGLNELSNHTPKKVHFISCLTRHRWAKVSQFLLGFTLLVFNFIDNLGHAVSDVNEENLGELLSQGINTKQIR